MKFKTVFILFNIVLIVSFMFILLLPVLMIGPDYFVLLLSKTWYAAVFFVAALAGVNVYFGRNWRVYTLLEAERWSEVIEYLEARISSQRRAGKACLRTLLSTYLATSDMAGVAKLETLVRARRPRLLARFALQFGIPYLLSGDPKQGESYFGDMCRIPGVREKGWLQWNYAFCMMQQGQSDVAKAELLAVLKSRPKTPLAVITLYLLNGLISPDSEEALWLNDRIREYRRKIGKHRWAKVVDRAGDNVQVLVLAKILDVAAKWLFGEPRAIDVSKRDSSSPGE